MTTNLKLTIHLVFGTIAVVALVGALLCFVMLAVREAWRHRSLESTAIACFFLAMLALVIHIAARDRP